MTITQNFIANRIAELEKQLQEFREYTKAPYIGNNHPLDREKDAYIQKSNSCNACIRELKKVQDFISQEPCVHPWEDTIGDGIVNPVDCTRCGKRLTD